MKAVIRTCILLCTLMACSGIVFSQTGGAIPGVIVMNENTDADLTISDAKKINEKPVIVDTIKKISNITYHITSKPEATVYEPQKITAAKMVNEPLSKLYHCLIKLGMGNYTTPYAELFINNTRSKEGAYGFRYKHLSSTASLKDKGFSGFSDNEFFLYGKKFLKHHTLSGDLNYLRNSNHFYGLDSVNWGVDRKAIRQVFNIIEAKTNLTSHFADDDTTRINHQVNLNFYNLTDKYGVNESNIQANGFVKAWVQGERVHGQASIDYYNHKLSNDTINNTIIKLNPYFVADGEKLNADIGFIAGVNQFSDSNAKFFFYPRLNISYNVYKNIVVPYAGINGDLNKNSFRNLTQQNPFLTSVPEFRNSSNKFEVMAGLRGAIDSKINYDAKVEFKRIADMAMFLIDYDNPLKNRFKVVYDDADVYTVSGQLKYSLKEKINIVAAGNYYKYVMSDFKYAWHRPSFDIKLSGFYNIKSKIIARADMFFIGNQWARYQSNDALGNTVYTAQNLKGVADLNLGLEYRYSKFLSGFVNFNNIANFRYYRWDRYPTQRFNFMLGVTFIPF